MDPARDKADLGIVVVHGIGSQATGDTLLCWAEPILKQLSVLGYRVSYGQTNLREDPAHVSVAFEDASRPGGTRHCWKFIEARWAESFTTPSASEVFGWAKTFVPRATSRINTQLTRPISAYWGALRAAAADVRSGKECRRLWAAFAAFFAYAAIWRFTWGSPEKVDTVNLLPGWLSACTHS